MVSTGRHSTELTEEVVAARIEAMVASYETESEDASDPELDDCVTLKEMCRVTAKRVVSDVRAA